MPVLTDAEIDDRLSRYEGWARRGDTIRKEFKFDDFRGSIDFITRITPIAEELNHHPDLAVSWNSVTVTLSTHSQGGVTDSDFELAGEIDELE